MEGGRTVSLFCTCTAKASAGVLIVTSRSLSVICGGAVVSTRRGARWERTHGADDVVAMAWEDDIENESLEGSGQPFDGRSRLRGRRDRVSGHLQRRVVAMEELAEEGTERLEASRVGAMDDDTGEGERRDGVGGEGEALAADGSDYLSLKGCDKGHVSELDREVRGRGDEGVELEDDAV